MKSDDVSNLHENVVKSKINLCKQLEEKQKFDSALECYEDLYRSTNKLSLKWESLKKIITISIKLNNFEMAELYIRKGFHQALKHSDKHKKLTTLYLKLGIVKYSQGKTNEALKYYGRVEKLLNLVNDKDWAREMRLSLLNNRAILYIFKRNTEKAVIELNKVIKAFEILPKDDKTNIQRFLIPAVVNLGNIYLEVGDLPKALYYLTKAEELVQLHSPKNHLLKTKIFINQSLAWIKVNNLQMAKERLNLARQNLQLNDDLYVKIHYLIAYSKYWQKKGDFSLSIKILKRANIFAKKIQNRDVEGFVYIELGSIHKILGNYREALEYLTKALRCFSEIEFYKQRIRTSIEDIESSFLEIASQWGARVELKDPYTLGHSARTTYYAFLIGKKLMDDELSLKGLLIGGFLHDIGKLKIDNKILLKRGKLTPEERREIEKHPVYAIEQLKNIEFPWKNVKDCILYHHEKYDGTGYPEGLKGDQIPLCARIIAVADVFDALTTDRPYRSALSWQQALKFIRENKGKYFDPVVVDVFTEILEKLDKSLISTQHTKHMVEELWQFFT